jgi:hypothetical protein
MPRPIRVALLGEKCDAVRKTGASAAIRHARFGNGLPHFGNTRPCALRVSLCDRSYRQRSFELECQGTDGLQAGTRIAF